MNSLHGGEKGWGKKIWQGPTPVGVRSIDGLEEGKLEVRVLSLRLGVRMGKRDIREQWRRVWFIGGHAECRGEGGEGFGD